MAHKTKIINISDSPYRLQFNPTNLERLVILPDYCPGKGIIPTGSTAIFNSNHIIDPNFIGPDMGCGMALARFQQSIPNLLKYAEAICLGINKCPETGSLGGGNHFFNLYQVVDSNSPEFREGEVYVLVHTGSRREGKKVFEGELKGNQYLQEHNRAVNYAKKNRKELLRKAEKATGNKLELVLDRVHNQVEIEQGSIVYRKGSVKLNIGDMTVIPSTFVGDAIVVMAKPEIKEIDYSMCHGTGRKISRSESKELGLKVGGLRNQVYIPTQTTDSSLLKEHPDCYRKLGEIVPLILPYVSVIATLKPIAFLN